MKTVSLTPPTFAEFMTRAIREGVATISDDGALVVGGVAFTEEGGRSKARFVAEIELETRETFGDVYRSGDRTIRVDYEPTGIVIFERVRGEVHDVHIPREAVVATAGAMIDALGS